MRDYRGFIDVALQVGNIENAIHLYESWKLFHVVNKFDCGENSTANLRLVDNITKLEIKLVLRTNLDSEGNPIPAAREITLGFEKTDFKEWFDINIRDQSLIRDTPWGTSVILRDPWGHVFCVYEPGDS